MRLWTIGEKLINSGLTSQGDYWKIQNKGLYISRAILLRSYWVRMAFTKNEIEGIQLPISKILPFLPYLAPKSKKFSEQQKLHLKTILLSNKVPVGIQHSKRSNQRKIESIILVKKLSQLIKTLTPDQIDRFKTAFGSKQLDVLKTCYLELLKGSVPSQSQIELLDQARNSASIIDTNLAEIFEIMRDAAKKTRTDSKVLLKKIFDPYLISPLLDLLFFNKRQ